MKFSVLMSIYDKESSSNLQEALESILNKQILKPDEVIIIKDGILNEELNKTLGIYKKKYKTIKVYKLKRNLGLGLALKYGITKCKNNLIFRMDSDDICHESRFKKQVEYLMLHPEIKIIGSNAFEFEDNIGNIKYLREFPEYNHEIKKFSKKRCPFLHPTVGFYKNIVLEIGNYSNYKYFEDYDIFLRILKKYQGYNLQESLLYFRVNESTYERRGGIEYFINEIDCLRSFYKKNLITKKDLIKSLFYRSIFRLINTKIRRKAYERILRKKL